EARHEPGGKRKGGQLRGDVNDVEPGRFVRRGTEAAHDLTAAHAQRRAIDRIHAGDHADAGEDEPGGTFFSHGVSVRAVARARMNCISTVMPKPIESTAATSGRVDEDRQPPAGVAPAG